MAKVIIMMGSKADLEWSKKIADASRKLGLTPVMRIASAHKVPLKCLEIIRMYENENVVFITVAGRSNALSGFCDAQTWRPVIACPPYADKFAGADVYSSLRMPSGVSPMVVLEPDNAALAAAKIFAVSDENVHQRVVELQEINRRKLADDDNSLLSE
ncbi:MAG: AIR carboxylase family protein [Cytophagaceae bacterium]|jgi:5-(carboxyamino)imidazole ribonucleotide mutase|nr:AIR carboxylase family protein [Cytophagaceae bacterium]